MEMKTKKLGVLIILVVLVIGAVLISRRAKPEEKTGPGGITVPSGFTRTPTEEAPAEEVTPEKARPEPGSVTAVHFSKLIPFLPEPPSGWVGESPYGEIVSFEEGSWSNVRRTYTKPNVDAWEVYATIEIVDSAYHYVSHWIGWEGGWFEYETTDGYMKRANVEGYPAWEEHTRPGSYGLYIGIDDRFVVSITANGVDRDTLYAFSEQIDYSGIAALK